MSSHRSTCSNDFPETQRGTLTYFYMVRLGQARHHVGREDERFGSEVMNIFVLQEDPSGGPTGQYMTRSGL